MIEDCKQTNGDTSNHYKSSNRTESNAANQKPSCCQWLKWKLWCVKSTSKGNPYLKAVKITEEEKPVQEEEEISEEDDSDSETPSTSTSCQSSSVASEAKQRAETPTSNPTKDRQVTFSDTVRTHVKTKYITLEEYQMMKEMQLHNGRILYLNNGHVVQLAEPSFYASE